MGKGSKKFGVILTTVISALLFCSLIVVTSLSPLSELGPNANTFNSVGMWSAIGMVLFFYTIPLVIYAAGVGMMRFIMAGFCSIGIFIHLSMLGAVLIMGSGADSFPYFFEIVAICIVSFIVNIIWFFQAFRTSTKPATFMTK